MELVVVVLFDLLVVHCLSFFKSTLISKKKTYQGVEQLEPHLSQSDATVVAWPTSYIQILVEKEERKEKKEKSTPGGARSVSGRLSSSSGATLVVVNVCETI